MSRFVSINLARLPALPLPERSFEAIYAARIAELTERLAAKGITFDTGGIDGDPLSAVEQAGAWREFVALTERDDAIRALMLATSWGAYLDHIGATQVPPVARLPAVEAPRTYETNPEDWEGDDNFRSRIQLAPEALSTCGSEGAYLFFALATAGVKAAAVYGPTSFGAAVGAPFVPHGEVHIPIVSAPTAGAVDEFGARMVDGTPSADLLAAVTAAVSPDERRPIADFVTVLAAEIAPYQIEARLKIGPGADAEVVRREAERRLAAQAARQHRPGAAQLRQMLFGAAYVADASGTILVEEVDLVQPAADVNPGPISSANSAPAFRAPFCTSIIVAVEVVND